MTDEIGSPVEYGDLTPGKLRKWLELRERGSSGHWNIDTSLMGKDFSITTFSRSRDSDSSDGPIAHVPGDRLISNRDNEKGSCSYRTRTIKTARDDANLIAVAVNALKPLCEALLSEDQLSETAWVIRWPEDKHYCVRYYHGNGVPPVRDINDAVRFSREADAKAVARDMKLMAGYSIAEHKWTLSPKEES